VDNYTKVSGFKKAIRSKAFTLIILSIGLIVLFTLLAPLNNGANFFTLRTFMSIMQDLAIPAFLAIGAGCLMVSGAIDLAQARIGALTGVIVAVGISWWGISWPVAVILGLAAAAVFGLINAILVNELNFQPFIATMAMSSVAYAIIMLVETDKNGQISGAVNFSSPTLTNFVNMKIGNNIPITAIILVIAFLIYGLVLSKTKFGRTLYLLGGNATAARLSGINSKRLSYFLFINCSVLGGISGLIYACRGGQGSYMALSTDQFTGLTAAILGGISFGGGSGGMGGVFIALLAIKIFNKGMTIIGASSYLTSVLSGALLLAALSLDYVSQRRQQKRIGA
jgi:ribose/xylose/arabinose/galactoside ABC-type transport system permease subunit